MKKNRKNRFFTVTGLIILCVVIFLGIHYLIKPENISVVKSKHDNGLDKEVWVYKKSIFGKEKKIKELLYYDNGNKSSEIDYKKGKVNGWARMWHKNGDLYVEATYKNSRAHGVRVVYHENGQVFCRAKYENGKLLGKENWDEEGNEIYIPIDR